MQLTDFIFIGGFVDSEMLDGNVPIRWVLVIPFYVILQLVLVETTRNNIQLMKHFRLTAGLINIIVLNTGGKNSNKLYN